MNELIVRDPHSGEEVGRVSTLNREGLARAVSSAQDSFQRWKHSTAFERSELLNHAATQLEARKDEFAEIMRKEAGKPITYARVEVSRAIGVLRWAAAEAVRYAGELVRIDATSNGREGFGIHQRFPRGIVLGITGFNFPLNLAAHKVAPAVACGCPILIKPSPQTPFSAIKLAELFSSVPGLVQVVPVDDTLTAELTRAPEIKTISFTGSARVGWLIRKQAPEKPTTLELGGNAWIIVMEDTPLELLPKIAKRIAGAAYGYAGQSCISVQNVAAARGIYDKLLEHLSAETEATGFGETASEKTVAGPVINRQARERIEKQLSSLPSDFRQVVSKTQIGKSGNGALQIPPTLVISPESNAPSLSAASARSLVNEEIFGPVVTLARFEEIPQIISRVSSSRYGLQAGVYTQNWATIQTLYRELEVGGLVVNDVPTTRYDHQPYGGVKESGLGREGIRYAMDEMTESKFLALSSTIPL